MNTITRKRLVLLAARLSRSPTYFDNENFLLKTFGLVRRPVAIVDVGVDYFIFFNRWKEKTFRIFPIICTITYVVEGV